MIFLGYYDKPLGFSWFFERKERHCCQKAEKQALDGKYRRGHILTVIIFKKWQEKAEDFLN